MKSCPAASNAADMEESLSWYQKVAGLARNGRLNPVPGTEIAFLSSGEGETEVERIRDEHTSEPQFAEISLPAFSSTRSMR